MNISRKKLQQEAAATGFRPEVLEKVAMLLGILNGIQAHPYLRGKLALKGGTALNLFIFDVPRLSVDIDLNYIGEAELDRMKTERPNVEKALHAVFAREGLTVRHIPTDHAGGKWQLRYPSAITGSGNLEVDLNYMYRVPLFPAQPRDSRQIGAWQALNFPVLDVHELIAGKLAALLARSQGRDLFDTAQLLHLGAISPPMLRMTFIVYGASNRKDWRTVTADGLQIDPGELGRLLLPVLRTDHPGLQTNPHDYGRGLVDDCRKLLSLVLPLTTNEIQFLDRILDDGIIDAALLTDDPVLQGRIQQQPLLAWKASNVLRMKGTN